MPVQFLVATMPSSDTGGDSVLGDQTDGEMDNRGDAEAFETIEPTEVDDCELIPVLSSIKDLVSPSESQIKRSFDVYEGGRNGNHINHCTCFVTNITATSFLTICPSFAISFKRLHFKIKFNHAAKLEYQYEAPVGMICEIESSSNPKNSHLD